jgi:hypothetical protein
VGIVIDHLKRGAELQGDLYHTSDGGKRRLMVLHTMMVVRRQDFKALEPTVDCLVTRQSSCRLFLVPFWTDTLIDNKLQTFFVSTIGNNPLVWCQSVDKSMTKNSQVWPRSRLVRTVDPNYVAGLNGDADLVSKTSRIQLMQIPDRAERGWLLYGTIDPIDGNVR